MLGVRRKSSVETLTIDKLGFIQNYYTSTLIPLINIVQCSKYPRIKSVNHKCFDMKLLSPD